MLTHKDLPQYKSRFERLVAEHFSSVEDNSSEMETFPAHSQAPLERFVRLSMVDSKTERLWDKRERRFLEEGFFQEYFFEQDAFNEYLDPLPRAKGSSQSTDNKEKGVEENAKPYGVRVVEQAREKASEYTKIPSEQDIPPLDRRTLDFMKESVYAMDGMFASLRNTDHSFCNSR